MLSSKLDGEPAEGFDRSHVIRVFGRVCSTHKDISRHRTNLGHPHEESGCADERIY
jgi:hypothetical protein